MGPEEDEVPRRKSVNPRLAALTAGAGLSEFGDVVFLVAFIASLSLSAGSPRTLGFVLVAFGVGNLLGAVLGGVLVDRLPAHARLVSGNLATAALVVVFAYATPLPVVRQEDRSARRTAPRRLPRRRRPRPRGVPRQRRHVRPGRRRHARRPAVRRPRPPARRRHRRSAEAASPPGSSRATRRRNERPWSASPWPRAHSDCCPPFPGSLSRWC
ncbi:hypothetical protein [Amycolatopsis orientalis]|uniref:hypothetical protein n=1 Tax=Amycolatopsis orientalis TaxID=31958 RepID=UPI0003F70FFD|nr:hypothetical protein [Amycolatopsis orientalis]